MKLRRLFAFCAVSALLLLFMPIYDARCDSYVEYKVQINGDNSADWTITRVSSISTSVDVIDFQERVAMLVDAVANETRREMAVDEDSLQMTDEISWETQSRKTVFAFAWQNFSISEDGRLMFGDVFRGADFFGQLYGDGALQINYPSTYVVVSVSPRPDERDDAVQMLKWLGTEYFINGEPEVILDNSQSAGGDWWQQYRVVAGLAVAVAAFIVGIYILRHRKSKAIAPKKAALAGAALVESDEEKIIKLVRSSGGKMRQSAITEQCRFSKAKTSQLLAALEHKRVITRYKRGRDKIVTLNEQATGEHQ